MWAINHNARASCFGRRHFKGITPAMSRWLNSVCKIMAWKYFSDQIAAFWQLQEVNHYQRKLFSDIISVCSGQEYSQFISLILCSSLLWVFYYCFLKIFFFFYFILIEEKYLILLRYPCLCTWVSSLVPETI